MTRCLFSPRSHQIASFYIYTSYVFSKFQGSMPPNSPRWLCACALTLREKWILPLGGLKLMFVMIALLQGPREMRRRQCPIYRCQRNGKKNVNRRKNLRGRGLTTSRDSNSFVLATMTNICLRRCPAPPPPQRPIARRCLQGYSVLTLVVIVVLVVRVWNTKT